MTEALLALIATLLAVPVWRGTDRRAVRVWLTRRRARVTGRLKIW